MCKHQICNKINDNIWKCDECGSILNLKEYQEILSDNCPFCNGNGEFEDFGDTYTCGCILKETIWEEYS